MKSDWRDRLTVESTLSRDSLENYFKVLRLALDTNFGDWPEKARALGYLRARRLDLLLELADSVSGAEHPTASLHFLANQFAALIKKVPFDLRQFGIDPELNAVEKFRATERRCGRYNLHARLENKFKRWRHSHLRDSCRRWIQKVIGTQPNFSEIWNECDFGPGASVGVSGNATHLAAKILAPRWSVTPSALPYALAAVRSNPSMWELLLAKEGSSHFSWDPDLFEQVFMDKCVMVSYNNIALVPKTAKVHRTIAVEPLLNGFLQKGVDVVLRRRLLRFGLNLKDQSRNQELARLGSLPDSDPYSTIDLSNASDSISIALARDLLPPEWFHFLNAIRSPSWNYGGVVTPYQKFCSMGNGFCFPLETLIFASVCESVYGDESMKTDYSVYGDDIIVRQSVARQVLHSLSCFGFTHNPDKTFITGPFRESCGTDWFLGEDVRPATLDSFPDSLGELFSLHNKTFRNWRCTSFFEEVRMFLRTLVPARWRFVRPVNYSGNDDSAFRVDMDLFMASPFSRYDRRTWSWRWKELGTYATNDYDVRKRAMYYIALLQGALKGANSETPFTKRRNTRTRVTLIGHHGGFSTWLPFT